MSNTETFAHYTNFNSTDGSASIYVGQATVSVAKAALTLDAAKIAKLNADADRVAKLCGWN